ncbi:MAG TPA: ADOP family duplicated permease [Terriglobales bacterium]|nr:ADOP family duplicated permease [Terriglobales bacterium]
MKLASFYRDLRVAARSLARVPALWAAVALTLALGIGANAAIFSVVRAVLLRPLANRDEARLLYIRQSAPGLHADNTTFSVPEIADLGKHLRSISELGTFSEIAFTLQGLGQPREVPAGVVDGNYFQVMGLRPILGRLLGPGDDGANAAGAVVLTYRFWTESLHSDPNVLGKNIRLDSFAGSRTATVVGVLEPSVPYPVATEIIANVVTSPHHLSATMVTGRAHRMTELFGRLAPTATLDQARSELHTEYAAMLAAHPEAYHRDDQYTISVRRLHDEINARANTVLWVLFAASALLFVIAASNVANLVLARTVRRESELAVRAALGASTAALRRSLLAESLLLCGSGVALALAIAAPMVAILGQYAARYSVRADDLHLDSTLVWFGIGLALAAALFLAYVPRLPSASASPASGLGAGGSRGASGSHRRLRAFAVIQITASFLLLAGAGLLLRTLYDLESTRPPFDTSRVLAVNLPPITYGRTPEQQQEFSHQVVRRVAQLPGVESVASGFIVPWRDTQTTSISFEFALEGAPRKNGVEDLRANFRSVSPAYFSTLGVPLLAGRDFRDSDKSGAEPVVIISKSVADRLFPGQTALNRTMHWTDPVMKFIGISYSPRRIVGVVPDFDDANIIPNPQMTIYQPVDQEGWGGRLFVRTAGSPLPLVPTIVRTIQQISPDQPVEQAATLQDVRTEILAPDKINALVFGGFAIVALLISVIGVAGVLGFSVSGRTREFGIRMALGADPRKILANVVREGVVIAALGVVAGFVVFLGGARALAAWIGPMTMPGAPSLVASAAVIVAAAAIAAAVPAARAARVNAVEALRAE